MLCRRDTPRNAFENPHIRAERGTCSALTADADEFGTARAGREGCWRAQKKRRKHSGVCLIGVDLLRLPGHRAGFFRGHETARRDGLDLRWSLVLCVYLTTVWVCGQFSGRSTSVEQSDRATKQRLAFYSQKKSIARSFCERKRVVCDLSHFSRVQRRSLVTFSALDRVSPTTTRRLTGTRSRASRRSCVPSSGRSSRSSTGTGSPPAGTALRSRSAGHAGWRCSAGSP